MFCAGICPSGATTSLVTTVYLALLIVRIIEIDASIYLNFNQFQLICVGFAGGIFVMLAMGHLIPEAIQVFTNLLPSGESASGVDYALQYTIVGFLGMLFIEKIAFDAEAIKSETNSDSMGTQAKTVAPSNSLWARLPVVKLNSAVVLCLAMSFHSFFEAAALGLAPDKISALLMASSIGLHQVSDQQMKETYC